MTVNYEEQIQKCKTELKKKIPDLSDRFHAETSRLKAEIKQVQHEMKTRHAVVEIDFREIQQGLVDADTINRLKRRGVVVIPMYLILKWSKAGITNSIDTSTTIITLKNSKKRRD